MDIKNFGARYDSLLNSLYLAIPNVTIIASTILPGTAEGIPENRESVNAQIQSVVGNRQDHGQKVILADVDVPAGFFNTSYIISDGIHPNDEGHRRLAAIYLEAIEEANNLGLISPPTDTGNSDDAGTTNDATCGKKYGSGASHGPVNTQQSSGLDDGTYIHSSSSKGVIHSLVLKPNAAVNLKFARTNKAFGNHDLVIVGDISDSGRNEGQRVYSVFSNTGSGWSDSILDYVSFSDTCVARGVRFVDVNGKPIFLESVILCPNFVNKRFFFKPPADGLDDMVCIAANGDTYVSINKASKYDISFMDGGLWKENEGSPQDRVRLVDIDGDDRADYCTIADNGDIRCWRNGGQGIYHFFRAFM